MSFCGYRHLIVFPWTLGLNITSTNLAKMLYKMFHQKLFFFNLIFLCPSSLRLYLSHTTECGGAIWHICRSGRMGWRAVMSGDAYFTPCSLQGMWVDRRGSDDKLQSAVLGAERDFAESVGEKKKTIKTETWVDGKNWRVSTWWRSFFCNWSHYAMTFSTHAPEMDDIVLIEVTWSNNAAHLITFETKSLWYRTIGWTH